MTQPIKIEIHLHIHTDGAVTIESNPKTFQVNEAGPAAKEGSVGGAATAEADHNATTLKTSSRTAAGNTKPVEPLASSSNTDAPAVEEAAAPVPPPAGKPDRNPNLLRTALYDASKRVGKDAALEVVARLAGGSLRNVTDETFDNVLNNLNALQKE